MKRVKEASRKLALISDETRNSILQKCAQEIINSKAELLEANSLDLAQMDSSNPLYDRLQLTSERLDSIAADMIHVSQLPSPLGIVTCQHTLPNNLRLHRVSVPFGVIGVIYESRPNVTFDVFALCLKSGNACILKGGHDAHNSNLASVSLIQRVLESEGVDPNTVMLMPATHEATSQMLNAVGLIDLCIPRGGRRLIDFVRNNARIPVIETGAGVVHTYFDKDADIEVGRRIVNNAKTRRVSVCNTLDCLLVHRSRLNDLDNLLEPMKNSVTFHFEDEGEEVFGREWMSHDLSIKIVDSIDDAISHIQKYTSGHSECIITQNEAAARRFQQEIDAACIYWNAPTSFTDGAQFGLGAEIGISTQKLGPRGPMALNEITTYKWIIEGEGQIRQ